MLTLQRCSEINNPSILLCTPTAFILRTAAATFSKHMLHGRWKSLDGFANQHICTSGQFALVTGHNSPAIDGLRKLRTFPQPGRFIKEKKIDTISSSTK